MIEKYNETSLADFFNYNDSKIHNWAENVYEKLRQTGELADYVKRDKVVRPRFNVVDGSALAPIMVKDSRFTFGYAYRGELLYIPESVYENIGRIYQIEFEFMVNEVVFGDIKIMDAQILISNDYSLTIHGISFQLPNFELNKLYKVKIVRENLEVSVYFDDVLIASKILNTNEDTVFNILYGSEPSTPPINVEYDLVVQSVNPGSGVTINVDKIDVMNRTHGVTAFTRRYIDGTIVQLTATIVGGVLFKNWVLDGVDQPANQVNLLVTVDQVHTAIAVYETVVIPLGSITVEKVVTGVVEEIVYGALYNWPAANDVRKITSSDDWFIPRFTKYLTGGDFQILAERVDGAPLAQFGGNTAGGKLKEAGLAHWATPNTGATNISKFNARGAGFRGDTGGFGSLQMVVYFWTNCEAGAVTSGISASLSFNGDNLSCPSQYGAGSANKKYGYSIRIVRAATVSELLLPDYTLCDNYIGNDLRVYRTVKIGTQVWIIDNLVETKFRNGDLIPVVIDNSAWAALVTGGMCYYDNDINNAITEGSGQVLDLTQFQVAIDNGVIGRSGYVSQGNPLVFTDLELGSYAVTEYPTPTHNLVSIETSPVVLTEGDPDQSVVITNEQIPEVDPLGSITINKTITGTSEDPSVEFEFTITGTIEPLLILTQMGSIGSPAVFNALPLDTYTITETSNPEYPLVSITPNTVTLTELNPNQVVAVVNEIAAITGFGLLYNFHAVNSSNILAPIGTRIATDADYTILSDYLGGTTAAGDKLRTVYDWGANAGTNSSGWSGRPGGFREFHGSFVSLNDIGIWWTSTGYTYDRAWKRDMGSSYEPIQRSYDTRKLGASVRFLVESGSAAATIVDIDGNIYNIVQIGTQRWATTNLKVTKYRNGVTIPYVANAVNWNNLTTGALCAYNNDPANI